ncbi:MAG TPA: hypothetical protein DCL61_25595 [Cyanobacteria bacterium UBA12227]|nr:hypothetical protein [Cyanobacteria bacterium UBA12227]HBY81524.1 hypothetical protein [Cyanobacteria bacterium UBA11148]
MDSKNLVEWVQTGFRVPLGVTTSLIESIQDPHKREENLARLQLDWSQQVAELAQKGETTEQEARKFVDEMLRKQNQSQNQSGSPSTTETASDNWTTSPTSGVSQSNQQEIEELTAQIAALRTELEQMRNSGSTR